MMSREDVLRELELLPVWQLRAPVQIAIREKTPNLETQPVENITAEIMQEVTTPAASKKEAEFDYFVSENNAWIFICPGSLMDTSSQGMLFDNILIALQIKAKKTAINLADAQLQTQAKVLVAMGENTAQTLLNSTETIDNLRAKQHELHNLPLIVTYSTAEILEHLPNKAKTWDDLCTALSLANA